MRMRASILVVVVGVGAVSGAMGARCEANSVLWYNGDATTFVGSTANQQKSPLATFDFDARIYEDFIVPEADGGWLITNVWSNNASPMTGIDEAFWEIRTGISEGDGGTVLFGGVAAATQTATGRNSGSPGFNDEYRIEVGGLNVLLNPGRYWLAVTPITDFDGQTFVSSTNGLNAVGTPPGDNANSYFDSDTFGADFRQESRDFSMGVAGSITGGVVVPEPTSLSLMAFSLLGLAGYGWRRSRRTVTG